MKSVLLTFYPETSSLFIQIGLTACFLIGPFLYLYTEATLKSDDFNGKKWLIHVIPIVLFMIVIGVLYPYNTYWYLWQHKSGGFLGWFLLIQWLMYTLFATYTTRFSFFKLFSKIDKPGLLDYWLINLVVGGFVIWLAYNTNKFTSYIVGALSFSFTIYITMMIWLFRRRANGLSFLLPDNKYGNKSISDEEVISIAQKLEALFLEEKTHLKSDLKLTALATKIQVKPHTLSQYLNQNLGQSFSDYINTYRVNAAAEILKFNKVLTIEGIGSECGFKSNTSFYTAFKKVKGMTPAQFQKSPNRASISSEL